VVTIGRNLRSVLIPLNWDFNAVALHNWDLWGPLVRVRWRGCCCAWVGGGGGRPDCLLLVVCCAC
jgi:hypothetical protein